MPAFPETRAASLRRLREGRDTSLLSVAGSLPAQRLLGPDDVPDYISRRLSIESLSTSYDDSDIDPFKGGVKAMPKKKTPARNPWTKDDIRQLKAHSKTRTPVVEVAKAMKRTEAAVRQKAKTIGIGLGHRR